MPDVCFAERLFEDPGLEGGVADSLRRAGVPFAGLGWDDYDCSVEIDGVPAGYRLSEEAQRVVHEAGFLKAYVNHEDRWETHYNFPLDKLFKASGGWRVSYPRKREDEGGKIWVEAVVPGWPAAWFENGEVLIKASGG